MTWLASLAILCWLAVPVSAQHRGGGGGGGHMGGGGGGHMGGGGGHTGTGQMGGGYRGGGGSRGGAVGRGYGGGAFRGSGYGFRGYRDNDRFRGGGSYFIGGFGYGFGFPYYYDPYFYGGSYYPQYGGGYGGYPNTDYGYSAPPVVINQDYVPETVQPVMQTPYVQAPAPVVAPAAPAAPIDTESEYRPPLYLIAFHDGSIHAAVAYWVTGDTLHYVTRQKETRTAPLAQVDRDFSVRLNRERRVDFRLPPGE
ncbi:MAG: hypothetical protein ABI165_18420 [Bryobacteraceae bacterium]